MEPPSFRQFNKDRDLLEKHEVLEKMRRNSYEFFPADRVPVGLSPNELIRGRITNRYK